MPQGPAGCFWASTPSGAIALCASGVPALQKTQSPKHVTWLSQSGSRAFFVQARYWILRYCDRQSTECPQIGAASPRRTCRWFEAKFFQVSRFRGHIFSKSSKFHGKCDFLCKSLFLTFRDTFGPQGGPAGTWECSHSIRHRISDIAVFSGVT